MNMARAELLGWGIQVSYQSISEETLSLAINKVLDNQVYTDNVKKISKRLKDQPQAPMERAIFWIEYVLRNDGAHFMQSSAQYLNSVEFYNLDVYSLFAIIAFLLVFMPIYLLRKVFKRFKRGANQKQKTK